MKKYFFATVVFLVLSAAVFAQNTTVGKSLAYPQMVAGGAWKTVLNLTNRGTTVYVGTLTLSNMTSDGKPQPWSPTINGTAITNGQMNISVNPGATLTLTITGTGATQAGFGTINPKSPSDVDETSLVEGTLTYYVMSGSTISDSIGIQPSDQIYATAIPFDTFSTIALALANTNSTAASVTLKVFSGSNQVVGTKLQPLPPNGYTAGYLRDIFPNVQLSGGRLEIQSDTPIIGTALTDEDGQFSSLPFTPAAKTYTWSFIAVPVSGGGSLTQTGTAIVRFNGPLVEIQSTQLTKNGQPVSKPTTFGSGTLINGTLVIYVLDMAGNGMQYYVISPFSLSAKTTVGSGEAFTLNPAAYAGSVQITLTATN